MIQSVFLPSRSIDGWLVGHHWSGMLLAASGSTTSSSTEQTGPGGICPGPGAERSGEGWWGVARTPRPPRAHHAGSSGVNSVRPRQNAAREGSEQADGGRTAPADVSSLQRNETSLPFPTPASVGEHACPACLHSIVCISRLLFQRAAKRVVVVPCVVLPLGGSAAALSPPTDRLDACMP